MYVGERTAFTEGPPSKKMDHLVCFLPGLLALGHFHGVETGAVLLLCTAASRGFQLERCNAVEVYMGSPCPCAPLRLLCEGCLLLPG